ncbi:MAG: cupin domain-containing protein [Bacteroidota bacterium]|nr:cupin domain-containing protein [Bacteroidota bacterium]
MKKVEKISAAENYAAATIGNFDQLSEHLFVIAPDVEVPGKVFVGEPLQSTGAEVSFTVVPAGAGGDFLHIHKTNEELYIVLKGEGEFQVDGNHFPISEGSVVRVSPDGKRAWKNTGNTPLTMICIQSKSGSLQGLGITDGVVLEDKTDW